LILSFRRSRFSPSVQAAGTSGVNQKQVEDTLSKDWMILQALDPDTQQRIKIAGENAASQITVLLHETKIQVKKVIDLIVSWLRLIPGSINIFLNRKPRSKPTSSWP